MQTVVILLYALHVLLQPTGEHLLITLLDAEERLLQREGADVEAGAREQVRDAGIDAGDPLGEVLAVARRADERREIYSRIASPAPPQSMLPLMLRALAS